MGSIHEENVLKLLTNLVKERTRLFPKDEIERSTNILETRFGGRPIGETGMKWPHCNGCGSPFKFVGQVHLSIYRHTPPFDFFAFYYCWECGLKNRTSFFNANEPNDAVGWKVVTYDSLKEKDASLLPLPHTFEEIDLIKERQVTSSLEKSFPDVVGFELHAPSIWRELNALVDPKTNRVEAGYWDKINRLNKLAASLVGFKNEKNPELRNKGLNLDGYPYWCNGPDQTPQCPECASSMELLVQISPDSAVHANWRDGWTPYVFYCAKHKHQFSLCFQGT
ncbi:DUF1963 domain-containing protein [Flagellimonas sp.]|uniref:DUF1963 domain-containing protein n=1 Tax=Flagellimonas sp. TaxID=2058762 RepID=UPI003B5B110B